MTDAGFIPGIYNYCDRWCERCDQRLHCMSFVMGKKIEERGGFHFDREASREGDSIWTRLKEVFESTYDVLQELAHERGMEVEDIYAAENIDKEFLGESYESQVKGVKCNAKVEKTDIIRMCMIYEDLADKYLEKIYESMDDIEKEKKQDLTDEALEVVNWYLDLIQAKLRRALYGYYYQVCSKHIDSGDYNGSAKVALLSIDRSIEGWKVILEYFPAYQREIAHLLIILEQLREDIEEHFPEARAFLRPGFEKIVASF